MVSFIRCQKPALTLGADDVGLEEEDAAEERAPANGMEWSDLSSPPTLLGVAPKEGREGTSQVHGSSQPPSSGYAESAFSASPLLGRSLLATSPS